MIWAGPPIILRFLARPKSARSLGVGPSVETSSSQSSCVIPNGPARGAIGEGSYAACAIASALKKINLRVFSDH
jgi:hypothetical protein